MISSLESFGALLAVLDEHTNNEKRILLSILLFCNSL